MPRSTVNTESPFFDLLMASMRPRRNAAEYVMFATAGCDPVGMLQ